MRGLFLVLFLSIIGLNAQEFKFFPVSAGSGYCPRYEIDTPSDGGYSVGNEFEATRKEWLTFETLTAFSEASRKDGSGFVAYPNRGKGIPMAALKGKVAVVVVFGIICDPSIRILEELNRLQTFTTQHGFELVPVHMDSWFNIRVMMRKNQKALEKLTLYKVGLGKEGLLNLGPEIKVLPSIFILDRQGKVAWRFAGYVPGALSKALEMTIKNQSGPLNAASPKEAYVLPTSNKLPSDIRLQGDVGKTGACTGPD